MTQVSEISFCSRIGYNIKTDESKSRLLDELEQKFNFKVIQKHFDKFTPNHIVKLNNNPHMVCVRTNGNPYLLYLTKINYINQCLFIDKKVQCGYFLPRIIISKFHFDEELFEGTLIDGEMVKDDSNNWIYIMNDILAINGHYLENVNLVKRLNMLYELLEKNYCYDEVDVCTFQIKKYFTYDTISSILQDFIPQLNYTCRGIYFKPLFLKFNDILYNFDDSLVNKVTRVKYKEVSNFFVKEEKSALICSTSNVGMENSCLKRNTSGSSRSSSQRSSLDKTDNSFSSQSSVGERQNEFFVKKTGQPDVYELYAINEDKFYGNAYIPSLATSKMMRKLFLNKNLTDKIKMTCIPSDKFMGKYVPLQEIQDATL
jgi:hypothetical protein